MFPLDYALAVTLLLASPDEALSKDNAPLGQALLVNLQAVGLALELLDPREMREIFCEQSHLSDDLKLMRGRRLDLCDAPPMNDCMRFPDRNLINDFQEFNRLYRKQLNHRQALEVSFYAEIKELIAETDRLYQIWDLARDSRTEYYYVWVRRDALKKLRERVGAQAYMSGCLPPHVPSWNFAKID